jgi:hypothetical protein
VPRGEDVLVEAVVNNVSPLLAAAAVVVAAALAGFPCNSAVYAEQYSLYLVLASEISGAPHSSSAMQVLR